MVILNLTVPNIFVKFDQMILFQLNITGITVTQKFNCKKITYFLVRNIKENRIKTKRLYL